MITIVVLAYQHGSFLPACLANLAEACMEEATAGRQVQIILADDASTDGSSQILTHWAEANPDLQVQLLLNSTNSGHTRTFNQALRLAQGAFIVDLAGDDLLPPGRLATQAAVLERSPASHFCHGQALYISEQGLPLYLQHPRDVTVPEGEVYPRLFTGRFISPGSVMFRTLSLQNIGGYDETLHFEDFDIWMRLARTGPVAYCQALCAVHRLHNASASAAQVRRGNTKTIQSVTAICRKALELTANPDELARLKRFIRYHIRLCAYTVAGTEIRPLIAIYRQAGGGRIAMLWTLLSLNNLGQAYLYGTYLKLRGKMLQSRSSAETARYLQTNPGLAPWLEEKRIGLGRAG